MTDLASGKPEDEPGPHNLWDRLIAGQITEVCVLPRRGLSHDLPQTLGLEVIQYDAYIYNTRGVVYTPEERHRIARHLADEPRWLAIGGPRYWVEPFAQRAGAILVLSDDYGALSAELGLAVDAGLRQAARWIRGILRKHTASVAQEPMMTDLVNAPLQDDFGDGKMTNEQLVSYSILMRNYFVSAFPEKTFLLGEGDLQRLQSVRALRPDAH
jgi:hypothetical protein